MQVNADTGWLRGVRRVVSTNRDARPTVCEPELIVIHAISLPPGQFGESWIEHFFCNALDPGAHPYFAQIHDLRVSAHFLIRRDGELVQFVSCNDRAWHAGESTFEGRVRCNDFSIGIELEGCDEQPFEFVQYQQLTDLLRALFAAYPSLNLRHIVGHADIAPGRKTDPGPCFDWTLLREMLQRSLI